MKYLLTIILLIFLASCSMVEQKPEDVYWKFHDACSSGDMATAESLATDDAKEQTKDIAIGVCMLTHDWSSRLGLEQMKFPNPTPEVTVNGNTAYLTWGTNYDWSMVIIMYKVDGNWKIQGFSMKE